MIIALIAAVLIFANGYMIGRIHGEEWCHKKWMELWE